MVLPFEPGKLTEEIKSHLPDMTKLMATRKANSLGMSLSEYVRDLVCLDVHGDSYDELMSVHRRKVRAAMQGQLAAQDRASVGPDEAQAANTTTDIQP